MDIIIVSLILYVIIVFVLSRFIVPHLGFTKTHIPEDLSKDIINAINGIKYKASSPYNFLELIYDFLGSKYRSERFNTILKFHYLFKNLDEIWSMRGYIPCTQNNFLMRIFLVRSGFFKDDNIKIKHVFVNFILHQYLRVKVGNKWINVDVGEKQRGLPIGKYLRFFG